MPFDTFVLSPFDPLKPPIDLSEQHAEKVDDEQTEFLRECIAQIQKDVESICGTNEAFLHSLQYGLPLFLIRSVDRLAEATVLHPEYYREYTKQLRAMIVERNYALLKQEDLFRSHEQCVEHQDTVENLLDMLRNPGYARLLLRQIAIRETAQTGKVDTALAHGIIQRPETEQRREAKLAYTIAQHGKMPRAAIPYFDEPPVHELFSDVDRSAQESAPTMGRRGTQLIDVAFSDAEINKMIAAEQRELTPPSRRDTE